MSVSRVYSKERFNLKETKKKGGRELEQKEIRERTVNTFSAIAVTGRFFQTITALSLSFLFNNFNNIRTGPHRNCFRKVPKLINSSELIATFAFVLKGEITVVALTSS
jgi:hypothetical protein